MSERQFFGSFGDVRIDRGLHAACELSERFGSRHKARFNRLEYDNQFSCRLTILALNRAYRADRGLRDDAYRLAVRSQNAAFGD